MNAEIKKTNTLFKRYKKSVFISAAILFTYGAGLGLLAPWIIETQGKKLLKQRLNLNLAVEKISINPFTFKVQITQLALTHHNDQPLIGFKNFSVDLELASLFNQAWTLDHIVLTGLYSQFERFSETDNTLSRLGQKWQASAPEHTPAAEPTTQNTELPRFLIRNIDFQLSNANIVDQVPTTPFNHDIGPLEIQIDMLSTLPENTGLHTVALKSHTGIALTWQGNIHLSPISSQGHIHIKGPYPVLASSYLQDSLVADINSGLVTIDLDYTLAQSHTKGQAPFNVLLSNINMALDDLNIIERSSQRPIYSLQKFSITDASVQWPEQIIDIPNIALNNGKLWLARNQDGKTNIEQLMSQQQAMTQQAPINQQQSSSQPQATSQQAKDDSTHVANNSTHRVNNSNNAESNTHNTINTNNKTNTPAANPLDEWRITNKRFELNDWTVNIKDNAVTPALAQNIEAIHFSVNDFQLKKNSAVTFDYSLNLLSGAITGEGRVIPMPFSALEATTKIENLTFSHLQPYAAEFAKITLADGHLNANIHVQSHSATQLTSDSASDKPQSHAPSKPSFIIDSDISINQLKITTPNQLAEKSEDTKGEKTFLQWEQLNVDAINLSTTQNALAIKKITLTKPYIDFKINNDSTTSIDHILISQNTADSNSPEPTPKTPTGEKDKQLHLQLGSFVIHEGSGYFADASLPLPFATKIHRLNGQTSALDNQSQASTDMSFKGQLDEYGLLNIAGVLTPFSPEENSTVNVKFENINIPNFTPYSVKFAGRKITDGRLDLNLNYKINKGTLQAKNRIVLRTFNLGETVKQPGALNLPLDLAIGLLKDNDNKITLDLPVTGDINNPEFSVSDVLGQALKKIIVSAISSPFRLLAGIVGGNQEDFGNVNLIPGSSLITPPEQEKLHKLAKAMQARPKLVLNIPTTFVPIIDTPILKKQQFLASAQAALGHPIAGDALIDKATIKYLEKHFLNQHTPQALKTLKQQFIAQEGKKTLDALAYAKALKQQAIEREVITHKQLAILGQQRAESIKKTITEQGVDAARIHFSEPKKIKHTKAEYVVIKLAIDTQK